MEIVKDAMLLDHDSWRKDRNNIINKVAKEHGGTKEHTSKYVMKFITYFNNEQELT